MPRLSGRSSKGGLTRRPIRARPVLHLIPNMITILGLCLGLTALRYGLDGRFQIAVALILFSAIVDGLDGRSARLLKITSRLGAELDSLVDFVVFGVIPAILVYLWSLEDMRNFGWGIAMLYATCMALRLARFNSELEVPDRPRWTLYFFTGVPAPAAAMLLLTPMMFSFVAGYGWPRSPALNAVLALFVSFMMVSRIPTFSLKRVRVRPDLVLPTLMVAGVALVFLVTEPWLAMTVFGVGYILAIPVSWRTASRMRRGEEAAGSEPAANPPAEPAQPEDDAERVVAWNGRSGRSSPP